MKHYISTQITFVRFRNDIVTESFRINNTVGDGEFAPGRLTIEEDYDR